MHLLISQLICLQLLSIIWETWELFYSWLLYVMQWQEQQLQGKEGPDHTVSKQKQTSYFMKNGTDHHLTGIRALPVHKNLHRTRLLGIKTFSWMSWSHIHKICCSHGKNCFPSQYLKASLSQFCYIHVKNVFLVYSKLHMELEAKHYFVN